MRQGLLGLVGALTLAATAAGTGCDYDEDAQGSGGGSARGGSSRARAARAARPARTGAPAAARRSGGSLNCTNVAPCGGSVVGTWNVTSSCLKLSGDMDMSLASLGCPTVPVNGSLQTTGNFRRQCRRYL